MAKYKGSSKFVIPRPILYKDGVNVETITVNRTLTYLDSMIQLITNSTAGSLNVVLPAEKNGATFWIKNQAGSASAISVNTPGGSGAAALAAGETVLVVCDGTNWTAVIKA